MEESKVFLPLRSGLSRQRNFNDLRKILFGFDDMVFCPWCNRCLKFNISTDWLHFALLLLLLAMTQSVEVLDLNCGFTSDKHFTILSFWADNRHQRQLQCAISRWAVRLEVREAH